MIITTHSEAETTDVGRNVATKLTAGSVVLLFGDLGAGKTAFVRGLAVGLGVEAGDVNSPTFTLVQEYRGGRMPLLHVDLYRLEQPVADDLWLREALYGDGVAAVEWFDRIAPVAGEERLVVTLQHAGHESRTIRLEARGGRHERLLERALVVSKTATR